MNADASSLLSIFEKKMRLEVPLFQRQYVWSREQQWEPLWEDISRKFIEYLNGRKDAPVHFLGALVLDQKQTPTTHVERRQVIDGQQRLTTFQIFLAAFRDLAREQGSDALANECDLYLLNKGMMAEPDIDRFKVWPTQLDRTQFEDVVTAGSRSALQAKHPLHWKKYARRPDRRPRMIEAYLYFYEVLDQLFVGTTDEPAEFSHVPVAKRLEECFQALRGALKVVVIDLDRDDDAQVIFETLNARGEPLLPADLLRNFVFLRAARAGEEQEVLYEKYWRRFDDAFWRVPVRQGRLVRPRSDLYLQHFLASRLTIDIPAKHLFAEYKHWIRTDNPFPSVRAELETLAKQGDDFRRILEPKHSDVLYGLATFLESFDVRTAYPLLLHLLDSGISDNDWRDVSRTLESYLLRRALCGLTTKNYNRVFLSLTKTLRTDGGGAERIETQLATLSGGDSVKWPDDAEFQEAWMTAHAYQRLQNKLVMLFDRLNAKYLSPKNESVLSNANLTVEHIMPQHWVEHWLLPNGDSGISVNELWLVDATDSRAIASRRRNALLQTLGNLTIITQPLNASVSNAAWSVKKPALMQNSLLPINQQLHQYSIWDEDAIQARGQKLLAQALELWPRPTLAG